jgi:hypothetical protein
MSHIYVWEFKKGVNLWDKLRTEDMFETHDEKKYFRVLRQDDIYDKELKKHFYYSLDDYIKHRGTSISHSFLYKN